MTTDSILRKPERCLKFFATQFDDDVTHGLTAGSNGALQMVEEADAVRQSLMTLLSTRPGERVMRPDYGCDLERLAFAGHGHTTEMLASLLIRRAIQRFEPRAENLQVQAKADPEDPSRLMIDIDYTVRRRQQQDHLALVVPTMMQEESQ
ncbi:type VI secretion system baseplate subunit TssE [Pseudaestuariivita rosea]|uniref:type VI secretion system baseplate subunit TssE n=1 Tax=Pseudaestuariivita rosea TaxID=2763263 RepID=UPI001ABB513C|nr:type VI secretion system baseplate subunit TssE [Pseudaestuariivita rosea]